MKLFPNEIVLESLGLQLITVSWMPVYGFLGDLPMAPIRSWFLFANLLLLVTEVVGDMI
jgi:hypothetical protein